MRLIDVDALHLCEYEPNTVMNTAQTLAHNEVVRMVLLAPAVDAKPVVHGSWKHERYGESCSHCGAEYPDTQNYERINYCPNCGAKMDLEE